VHHLYAKSFPSFGPSRSRFMRSCGLAHAQGQSPCLSVQLYLVPSKIGTKVMQYIHGGAAALECQGSGVEKTFFAVCYFGQLPCATHFTKMIPFNSIPCGNGAPFPCADCKSTQFPFAQRRMLVFGWPFLLVRPLLLTSLPPLPRATPGPGEAMVPPTGANMGRVG